MSSVPARLRRVTTPVDAALGLVLVVGAVVETLANTDAPQPAIRAVLAAVAVATVAVRSTFPATAAGTFAAAMTAESLITEAPDELAILLGLVAVSYSVAAHAPRREAWLGGALLGLALAVTIASDPSDSLSNIPPSLLLFIGLPFGVGLTMRARRQDVAALTLETAALARAADAAVDVERRRIARELHDVVSHAVTLIAVQSEAGQAVMDDDPAAARRSLEAIGQVSRDALAELGHLLAVLREDETTADEPDLAELDHLVEGARAAGLTVEATTDPGPELDPAAGRCAYRVVQEGLTNALRHTSNARVRVSITRESGILQVTVTSEGRPHASSYGGTGRGLVGLRERVLALGGTFEASPSDGQRFEIRAALPVHPARVVG